MITNALGVMVAAIDPEPTRRAFALSDGDCGLVIRKDGQVELFQQGMCMAALHQAHSSVSNEDRQALLNGQLLMVLSIVAHSPELQQTILGYAVNQGVAEIQAANANG
ncbi:hypothetical protein EV128_125107 [Rhizobium azibense]|nr:hypothetical protein EV128_125107 [Rhizobium azibense]